jgi:hypothetical protein
MLKGVKNALDPPAYVAPSSTRWLASAAAANSSSTAVSFGIFFFFFFTFFLCRSPSALSFFGALSWKDSSELPSGRSPASSESNDWFIELAIVTLWRFG